jgi:hypothetical protein
MAHFKDIKHVKATVYNTLGVCTAQSAQLQSGEAVVVPDGAVLMKDAGGNVRRVDLRNENMDALFDRGAGQDEVYQNVLKKLDAATQARLEFDPNEYTIEMVDAGSKFMIEATDARPCIYAVSCRIPTYFDLGMIVTGDRQLITYCHTTSPDRQLKHSGDIGFSDAENQQMLMHKMSGTFVVGKHHPVILTGYTSTPLIRFSAYRPVVLVVDHTMKIVHVVSVPLDEDNVGQDKVLTMPFGVTRVHPLAGEANQQLLVTVYPNPFTDMGSLPTIARTAWMQAARAKASMNVDRPVPVKAPAVAAAVAQQNEDADVIIVEAKEPDNVVAVVAQPKVVVIYSGTPEVPRFTSFLQADVVIKAMTTHAVFNKTMGHPGYSPHSGYHRLESTSEELDAELGARHFPSLLPMEGGRVLLAARSVPMLHDSQQSIDQTRNSLFHGNIPVFFLGPMDDSSRKVSTSFKINGLYIYPVDNPGAAILDDLARRRDFLADINTNAATAYAGPMSITLVEVCAEQPQAAASVVTADPAPTITRYFFLDGARQAGFLEVVPDFAAEVTELVERNLIAWLRKERDNESSIIDTSKGMVTLGQEHISFDKFKRRVAQMNLDEILANETHICDVITQAQRLFDDGALNQHSNELITLLTELKANAVGKYRGELQAKCQASLGGDAASKKLYADFKGKVTRIRKAMGNLIQKLGLMVSKKKQSSMKFNLAQLRKKQLISNNVDRAQRMTLDDFEELMDKTCGQTGVLWLNLNTQVLHHLLKAVGASTFTQLLLQPVLPLIEYRNGDFNMDAFTISLLVGQTAEQRQDPVRPLAKDTIVTSLPVSAMSYDGLRTGSWFFPLLDEFSELKDPFCVRWVDKSNESDIAALRILARGTLTNAAAVRELAIHLKPSDKQIAWFLVYLSMGSIQELIVRKGAATEYIKHKSAAASSNSDAMQVGGAGVGAAASSSSAGEKQQQQQVQINFDDTLCINIRCMLAHILTITASGAKPLSMVWQLFTKNTRPDLPTEDFEWGVYANVIQYAKFTGWDMTQLQQNVRALLVRQLNRFVIKATEPLRAARTAEKRDAGNAMKEHCMQLRATYYPHYKKIVEYCQQVRSTDGAKVDQDKLREFAEVFFAFNNRRVRTGSIFSLMTHAKKDLINHAFVDELITDILHKWNNYDRKLKVAIYEFAMELDARNAEASGVSERVVAFRRALNKGRAQALAGVKSEDAQEPIVNHKTILALLNTLQHVPSTKKKPNPVEIEAAIFAGEGKYAKCWEPFDPFPQFGLSEDQVKSGTPYANVDAAAAAAAVVALKGQHFIDILGEANFTGTLKALLMAPNPGALLQALTKASNFNSERDYLSLARFAGFGKSSGAIAGRTKSLLYELLKKWSVSGDEAEQHAIMSMLT